MEVKEANSVNETTNLVQEMHEKHLRISFTTIARTASLGRLANFHNDQVRHDMTCALVQAGVDLAHVVLSGRESLVKARKSWYTELVSVLFEEYRVTNGLTEPIIPSHRALTYINKGENENEENQKEKVPELGRYCPRIVHHISR
jgi:hypothetical protein